MVFSRVARRALRLLVPPLLLLPLDRIRIARSASAAEQEEESSPQLFDGDSELFKRIVGESRNYAEYGVGLSTLHVLNETQSLVRSVDTSAAWVESVVNAAGTQTRLDAVHVDLGPVVDSGGRPVDYRHRSQIGEYLEAPFAAGFRPDCVLIDGRFRVACFLTALLRCEAGSNIVFDDYTTRLRYHVVEEVCSPVETFGRQALFVVPDVFDRDAASRLIEDFRHVMD